MRPDKVLFTEEPKNSIVNKLYWSVHEGTIWFSYKWTRNAGLWLINLETKKIKCISERAVDRGYNTITDYHNSKQELQGHATGMFFSSEQYQSVLQQQKQIKVELLNLDLNGQLQEMEKAI
jgi:hypothetical protein